MSYWETYFCSFNTGLRSHHLQHPKPTRPRPACTLNAQILLIHIKPSSNSFVHCYMLSYTNWLHILYCMYFSLKAQRVGFVGCGTHTFKVGSSSPPQRGLLRAEVPPLPVDPMGPYFRKIMYSNQRQETNIFLIPF